MGQSVSVLVILSSKALLIVFTSQDGAFLGSLRLMSQHMSLQIFEDLAAICMRASALLAAVLVQLGDWARARASRHI